jgi:hypothetical protein
MPKKNEVVWIGAIYFMFCQDIKLTIFFGRGEGCFANSSPFANKVFSENNY